MGSRSLAAVCISQLRTATMQTRASAACYRVGMGHATLFRRAAVVTAATAAALTVAAAAQTPRTVQLGDRWVCVRADAQHAQNATMSDNVSLSCTQIAAAIPMQNGGMMVIGSVRARPAADVIYAPSPTAGLNPTQLNTQWEQFVKKTLQIPDVAP